MGGCVHQHLHRLCDMFAKQENHHPQQRQHQQYHREDGCLQLRQIAEDVEGRQTCVQCKRVIGQLPGKAEAVALCHRPVRFAQAAGVQREVVEREPCIARHDLQRFKERVPVHKLHHACIGLKAVIQQIARDVEVPVNGEEADGRVCLTHGVQDYGLGGAVVVSRQAVAANAAAHHIGVDAHLVPEADEYRFVALLPSKTLGEIVVDAAVEGSLVPVLLPCAVGSAHHAVVADGLGVGKGCIQMGLKLLERVGRVGFQAAGHVVFIVSAQQKARQRHDQPHRHHPAQQDRGHKPCAQRAHGPCVWGHGKTSPLLKRGEPRPSARVFTVPKAPAMRR